VPFANGHIAYSPHAASSETMAEMQQVAAKRAKTANRFAIARNFG
jgi:hypothetical protein